MKITYINHSGFLLEWEHCYWLFDYYQGEIPRMNPEKMIFVFSSHSHSDHFNPQAFALARVYPRMTYVFSNEIRRAVKKLRRNSQGIRMTEEQLRTICGGDTVAAVREETIISAAETTAMDQEVAVQAAEAAVRVHEGAAQVSEIIVPIPEITFLQSGTDTEMEDGGGGSFRVHTLFSTDCGCGFVLSYEGKIIYHAGDLHWWTWPGESETENRDMAGRYKKQIEYLAGRQVDLAFTPLDPRQEQDYGLGLSYLLKTVCVRNVFPMHFWNDFSIQEKYLSEYSLPEHTKFYKISRDGQSWTVAL